MDKKPITRGYFEGIAVSSILYVIPCMRFGITIPDITR